MHADADTAPARQRAGGTVLSLIAGPLCVPILRAHLDGPLRLPDLRERIGGAAQTTLRGQVGNLRGSGALERKVIPGMPYTVENDLSDCGRAILEVADHAEAWLARAPQGPIALGSENAKGAIRALVGGWNSTVLRALAASPLALTELNVLIKDLSYPALERRLSSMRAARQIEVRAEKPGKARPYAVTEWARQAVTLLVAAGRCECRHLAESTAPLTTLDVEAAFLLAAPLAVSPAQRSGSFLFAAEGAGDDGAGDEGASVDDPDPMADPDESAAAGGDSPSQPMAGVQVEVADGKVVSCVSRLEQDPETWALGSVEAWAEAILAGELEGLDIGGRESRCAEGLIESLHRVPDPA